MVKHGDFAEGPQGGRLSRRKVLIGAGVLAASPLLAGISFAADATTMRLSWWGSDDRHKKTLALIKLFESKHPGLTVTPEYGGFVGYQDKLSTEFAGGNAPDVMQVADSGALVASGRLQTLDDYIASGKIDLSDANKGVLETSKVNGKLYSVPWGLACGCYFIDNQAFGDAKVDIPDYGWTWIANAVRWALGNATAVTIEGGHGLVTPTLYRQDKRQILHLNNRLLTSRIPGRQDELVPVGPLTVRLCAEDGTAPAQVELRVGGGKVAARREGERLVFTVDQVLDHEVVVVDWT